MNNIDIARYKRIVTYFWDPEPRNDDGPGSSVWCLGKEYITPDDRESQRQEVSEVSKSTRSIDGNGTFSAALPQIEAPELNDTVSSIQEESELKEFTTNHGWSPAFLDDFESRIWLTYRSNFPPIPKSDDPDAFVNMTLSVRLRSQLVEPNGFTSDTGWGCMIRSGQSLLANTLSILSLGRGMLQNFGFGHIPRSPIKSDLRLTLVDWRRGMKSEHESKILSLFADDPRAPFSIHKFVNYGASYCGKHPGEWFGPSATARCIQGLSNNCSDVAVKVYVTNDSSDVHENKFREIACNGSDQLKPTLILLGIRLGIDRVTPVYWESLKEMITYPQSVGIAGGRPSASHYFVGVQGSSFFFLDPHHTRPALSYCDHNQLLSSEEIDSCHTRKLRRLHIEKMDPSMLIGFLIKNENDWQDWKRRVTSTQGARIIHVFDVDPVISSSGERASALDEVEVLDDDE